MPYTWLPPEGDTRRLHLWPHRSLPRTGFVWFIGCTAMVIALPLLAVLGSPVLWGLLPFLMLAVGGIWWGLQRSYRDGEILEELTLDQTTAHLTREGPRGKHQEWQANTHWVRVELHRSGGPVPNYVTLKGGPREVEIGAFLSEAERITLRDDLSLALSNLRKGS